MIKCFAGRKYITTDIDEIDSVCGPIKTVECASGAGLRLGGALRNVQSFSSSTGSTLRPACIRSG